MHVTANIAGGPNNLTLRSRRPHSVAERWPGKAPLQALTYRLSDAVHRLTSFRLTRGRGPGAGQDQGARRAWDGSAPP